MTREASTNPFDFRTPGNLADQVEEQLATWQRTLCETVAERWEQHLSQPVDWSADARRASRAAQTIPQLSPASLGLRLALRSRDEISLFVFPRQMLLSLVQNTLGDVSAEMPEDRELTSLELSLVELLMQELVVATGDAMPGAEPLPCDFQGWEPRPHRTRLFKGSDSLVVSSFTVTNGEQKHDCTWLVRQTFLKGMFEDGSELPAEDAADRQKMLEVVAEEIPFDVVVRLGKATLKFSDLASLQPGDVILLDQPIRDQLEVVVSDRVRFKGRAGRSGSRRAFQIESVKD